MFFFFIKNKNYIIIYVIIIIMVGVTFMRIKKRGFTLIELLVVIAIISVIFSIGFVIVFKGLNNSDSDLSMAIENLILDAVEQYVLEYGNDDEWSEEVEVGGVRSSCVTIDSLINYGYFKGNEEKIRDFKERYFVKVTMKNGIASYEFIELNKLYEVCKYYDNKTEIIDNGNASTVIKEKDSDNVLGNFNYIVTKIDDKVFETDIDFKINFEINEVVTTVVPPVYVMMVLDRSGSMSGNKYTMAKSAVVDFSNIILNDSNVPGAKIGLITYASFPGLVRTFENKSLENVNFGSATGTTDTGGAINLAKNTIMNFSKEEDALVFTILLFDGMPNNESTLITAATELKNIGSKLIVVGYEFAANDTLKRIATNDSVFCEDSSYSGYCYYNSSVVDVGNLFSNLSKTIVENVKSTDVKEVKVILSSPKLENGTEPLFMIEQNGKMVDSVEKVVKLDNLNESVELSIKEKYNLIINDNFFDLCKENTVCDQSVYFDIEIVLVYEDGTSSIKISNEQLPSFKVTSTETGKVN